MRTLLLLGCLYLSLGLSHAEPATQEPAADTGKKMAQLIIGRDEKVPETCDVELQLEEKTVAQLQASDSINLDLPAGTHYLRAKLSAAGNCTAEGLASGQSILLEPGETRQYQVMFDNDALFLAPQLEE
ncbi:hypothetical protein [Pseudomonas sp. EA_35y_Pfl2_R111]|uniref:hypothetical protein n=1 Tax=Pseudomonas sp. EA_35y_Pfl2_R111 TaxID=3088689 RepID=UPI0030DCE8CB